MNVVTDWAWLRLAPLAQRRQLAQLLALAGGQEEAAASMLLSAPSPETLKEASARLSEVCEFLMDERK